MKRHRSAIISMGGVIALFFSQLLSGCDLFARWKTVYEGTYTGTPYVVQERETKGFSTNRIDYRFRLGNLPAVELTALTTDWGPPYSNDIFGTAPYCYTAPDVPAYRSVEKTDYATFEHVYTMVYLSPGTFSKEAYDQYCAFLKSEWPAIDKKYAFNEYTTFPHVIGLVHARQDDITKDYKGSYKPYPVTSPTNVHQAIFRVQNDGRVQIVDLDEQRNIRYVGLSTRVQMPGKRIYLGPADDGIGTMEAVRIFKDKRGRTPDMDFQFLPHSETNQP